MSKSGSIDDLCNEFRMSGISREIVLYVPPKVPIQKEKPKGSN